MSRVPTRSTRRGARAAAASPAVAGFRPAGAALAVAAAFAVQSGSLQAQSVPIGVIHGAATFARNGNNLLVTTTNGAGTNHSAINWQNFSVPGGSTTYFQQPSAASTSINRVLGSNPSEIFGTLGSNGKLVLVNPAGIAVGKGALVDTAGFTASTLGMSDADAIAGRMAFSGAGVGVLQVDGHVIARGGDIVLIGSKVQTGSEAVVQADGAVVLAAGQKAEITGRGLEGIRLEVQAGGEAVNLGALKGDAVGIFANTLTHSGLVQAQAVTSEGGKVVLKATGGDAIVSGSILASAGSKGGQVDVFGQRVGLMAGASIDASGAAGGGQVRIGGDFQGQNPEVPNAQNAYVDAAASIKADANQQGDGGRVIVWADDATRMRGHISARGGAAGGNGGFAEVSGKRYLDYTGRVDLRAPAGTAGMLLLDPGDVLINAAGPTDAGLAGAAPGGFVYSGSTGPTVIKESDLEAQLALASVMVRTDGTSGGKITLDADAVVNWSTDNVLGLQAENGVDLQGELRATGTGAAAVSIQALGGNVTQGSTSVVQVASLLVNAPGGSVTMDGANRVNTLAGNSGSNFLFTNAQSVTLGNVSTAYGAGRTGITAGGDARVKTTAGNITVATPPAPTPPPTVSAQNVTLQAAGNIDINGSIAATAPSTGTVVLQAGGNINQLSANSVISAQSLLASAAGSVSLTRANQVATLAGSGTSFDFHSTQAFAVGTVATVTGVNAGTVNLLSDGDLSIGAGVTGAASGGVTLKAGRTLSVSAAVNSQGGFVKLVGGDGTFNSEGSIYINSTGSVTSSGGQVEIESRKSDTGGTSFAVNGTVNAGAGKLKVTAQSIDVVSAGVLKRSGADDVELTVDGLNLTGATGNAIESIGGRVVINPLTVTPGTDLAIIGAGGTAPVGAYNLFNTQLDKIQAQTLVVGNGGLAMPIVLVGNVALAPALVPELSLITNAVDPLTGLGIRQASGTLAVAGVNLDAPTVDVSNAGNQVSTVSGRYDDRFHFHSDSNLTIGMVDGIPGVQIVTPTATAPELRIGSDGVLTVAKNVTGTGVELEGNTVQMASTAQVSAAQVGAALTSGFLEIHAYGTGTNNLAGTLNSDSVVQLEGYGTWTLGNVNSPFLQLVEGGVVAPVVFQQGSGTLKVGFVSGSLSAADSVVNFTNDTNEIGSVSLDVNGVVKVTSSTDLDVSQVTGTDIQLKAANLYVGVESSVNGSGDVSLSGTGAGSTINLSGGFVSAGTELSFSTAGDVVLGEVVTNKLSATISGSLTQDPFSSPSLEAPGGVTANVGGSIDLTGNLGYVSGSAGGSIVMNGVSGVAQPGLTAAGDISLSTQGPVVLFSPQFLAALVPASPGDLDLIGSVTSTAGNVTLTSANNILVQEGAAVSGASLQMEAVQTQVYGTLLPGGDGAIGSASVAGDLFVGGAGAVMLDVDSVTSFDTLSVTGVASTDSTAALRLVDRTGGASTGSFTPTTLGSGSSLSFKLPAASWSVSSSLPYLVTIGAPVVAPAPPPSPLDEKLAADQSLNQIATFATLFIQESEAQQQEESKDNAIGKDDIVVTETACTAR